MFEIDSIEKVLHDQIQIPGKLLMEYKRLGLNEIELILILQLIRYFQEENFFPTPSEIASSLTISEQQCSELLMKLMQKGFLKIDQKENEIYQISEAYSLNPLLEKLYAEKPVPVDNTENTGTLFILFEQEFGRPLSPFEIEMVSAWLDDDQFLPSLIKAALRESVLMGKLNFKYIDRILREWNKKGIKSVEEARNASKNFHQHKKTQPIQEEKKRDTSVYYNWLEGEN